MPAVYRVLFWEPLFLVLNINNCVLTLPQNWNDIQPLVQESLSITYFFCSFRFCFHVILTLEFRSDSNNVHKGLLWLSVLQSYKRPAFILCASFMRKSLQLVTLIVTKTLWGGEYNYSHFTDMDIWNREVKNISNSLQLLNDEAKIQIELESTFWIMTLYGLVSMETIQDPDSPEVIFLLPLEVILQWKLTHPINMQCSISQDKQTASLPSRGTFRFSVFYQFG